MKNYPLYEAPVYETVRELVDFIGEHIITPFAFPGSHQDMVVYIHTVQDFRDSPYRTLADFRRRLCSDFTMAQQVIQDDELIHPDLHTLV